MSKSRSWPAEDRDDYEAACERAWVAGETTRERGDAFLDEVEFAASAGKVWARDLLGAWMERGAQREINEWSKALNRVYVTYNDRVLNRPRVIGVQRKDDEGAVYVVQALFDVSSWAEIEQKVAEWERQIGAYRDNITAARRILELRAAVPEAQTPAEAVEALGITLDDWLGEEQVA